MNNSQTIDVKAVSNKGLRGYQAAIAETYAPMEMRTEQPNQECPWSVVSQQLDLINVSHVVHEGPVHASIPARSRKVANEQMIVLMCVEQGSVELAQGNSSTRCDSQMVMLMDVGRPLEVGQRRAADILSATMPTGLLRFQFPEVENRCGLALPAATGAASVLRDFLRIILREREAIDPAEARTVSNALGSLIACVFRNQKEPTPDASIVSAYSERIQRIIEAELQNPDLGPRIIAERLRVSPSYLFSIARKAEISIEKLIINKRLDRCRELLADAVWSRYSVTYIALTLGFKDLSHFSRRFSERFGLSPNAYRKIAGGTAN